METYEFTALIHKHEGMDAAYVEFPFDAEQEFGSRGQIKVRSTFDGAEYRGSLAKMGHHCHCLGITKEIRKKIGKSEGDMVHVVLRLDTDPRVVEPPEDLLAVMTEFPCALERFHKMSYTLQKECVAFINQAKKQDTRDRRIHKVILILTKGD